jgi:integrase
MAVHREINGSAAHQEIAMRDNRRAHGEGSYRQKEDGTWEGRFWVMLPSGERKRLSRYGKTKKEVSGKLSELRQQAKDNTLSLTKPLTLAQYLEGWWNNEQLKPSTLESRELNIRMRIVPAIGGIRLDKLTSAHIRQMDNSLLERGLSGASRMQAFAVLKTAMRNAFVEGLISSSPFDRVTWKPSVQTRAERILSMQQKALLLAQRDSWTPLWKLLIATGMRSGEALGLSWDDVDLQGNRLHIKQSIQRIKGGYRIGTPKTKQSRRTLEIQPIVADIFREIRAAQQAEATRIGEGWIDTGFVFTRNLGEPTLPTYAHSALQRSLKRAGIAPARVHDLRHTFASDQLLAGTPMSEVSRMLGHSTVAFTLQVYAHILPEVQSQASQTASRILEEAMQLAELQGVNNAY